jgi:hypothetical protein
LTHTAAKVDANQPAIVKALRDAGCKVQSLAKVGKGCPDLLVYVPGFGLIVAEVKMPGCWLNEAEKRWHAKWEGAEVWLWLGVNDAIESILRLQRESRILREALLSLPSPR